SFTCFFSSRRRHTRSKRDWSSDVCSSDLAEGTQAFQTVCDDLFERQDIVCAVLLPTFDEQFPQRFATHVLHDDETTGDTGTWIGDRKSTRLNSSHVSISYAVFCLKKKNKC